MVNFTRMRTMMRQMETAERNKMLAWAIATKCTQSFSNMPKGGETECRVERGTRLYLDAKDALKSLEQEYGRMKDELRTMLPLIKDGNVRAAMEGRYICKASVRRVAIDLCYSERHVIRLLRQGEAEIEKMGG